MGTSRRTFLRASLGAASAVSIGAGRELLAAGEGVADVLLKNGAIVTMSDKLPAASAMAVKGDKVLAVGAEKALGRYVGRATRTIDLKGRGVSPGLIDAHSHLIGFGQMELMYVPLRPPKVRDFASLNRALAAAARQRPRSQWIVGRGFQEFREGRFPRRQELDKAVPHHPVLIIHWGGQFGVANTLALIVAVPVVGFVTWATGTPADSPIGGLLRWLAFGGAYGVVTGTALWWLLQERLELAMP